MSNTKQVKPNKLDTKDTADAEVAAGFDVNKRFVKILKRYANDLVLFEFSIGWTDLVVELILPNAAFQEFCERNAVIEIE